MRRGRVASVWKRPGAVTLPACCLLDTGVYYGCTVSRWLPISQASTVIVLAIAEDEENSPEQDAQWPRCLWAHAATPN